MWFMEEDGNNKIYKSLISSAGLLFGLFFCHFIEISVAGYQLKKIDIISDIKADTIKFISKNPVVKKQFIDSCKNGLICFEDYSDDTTALNKIFNAFFLDEVMNLELSAEKIDSFKQQTMPFLSENKQDFIQYANICQIRSNNNKNLWDRKAETLKKGEELLSILKNKYGLK